MPRAGYDLTGTATGSPASEAAARARQRTAPGNRTPRVGTPATPSRPDGDGQETPRASRIGISARAAVFDPPTYSQMHFANQDPRALQTQRGQPRQELYQNPLNIGFIQAANQATVRPVSAGYDHGVSHGPQSSMFLGTATPISIGPAGLVNASTRFGDTSFGMVGSGARQQQRLWNNSQSYALPNSQRGIQIRHSQAATGPAQHFVPGSMSTAASANHAADEDAEMVGVDNWRY